MYERRHETPLSRADFLARLVRHVLAALAMVAVSLAAGMAGYVGFEGLSPIDAFLNAAMLLGGMGPVNAPATPAGKLFAGAYALYAGLVFLVAAAVVITPVAHRVLHTFHWDAGRGGR
ncbi:MAG: hypothetical protein U1E86_19860 [Burkholderiaceae bacterium]